MKTPINYSYVKATESDWITSCVYRGTEVIRVDNNNKTITLNTWWWYSTTTKKYMNKFLPLSIKVFQKDFSWYITDFRNKDSISYDYKKSILYINSYEITILN